MDRLEEPFKKSLSKFKWEEVPDLLPFVFGDSLSWEDVAHELDALRLGRRPKNIAGVCWMLYKETSPTKEDAIKTLWLLQLYEVSAHSNRQWFGIKLKAPFPDAVSHVEIIENIEKNLERAYRKELRTAIVYRTVVGSCHFVMANEEKNTKKGPKYSPPVFFVFNANMKQPYVFYTPKLTKTYPLDCFTSAFGYQEYRLLALCGENVDKLFESVQKKKGNEVALRQPVLDIVPVTQEYITDLTAYSSRIKFAKDLLPGATKMKTFTVQSQNEWRGTSSIPELRTRDFVVESTITIQTKNGITVEEVLRKMIAHGNIQTPMPSWLLKFAERPRNTIKLASRDTFFNSSGGPFEQTDGTGNDDQDEDVTMADSHSD